MNSVGAMILFCVIVGTTVILMLSVLSIQAPYVTILLNQVVCVKTLEGRFCMVSPSTLVNVTLSVLICHW